MNYLQKSGKNGPQKVNLFFCIFKNPEKTNTKNELHFLDPKKSGKIRKIRKNPEKAGKSRKKPEKLLSVVAVVVVVVVV